MKKVSQKIDLNEYRKINFKLMFLPSRTNILMYLVVLAVLFLGLMILIAFFPPFTTTYRSTVEINLINIFLIGVAEILFAVVFISMILIKRYLIINKLYNSFLKENEYIVTADDKYLESDIGDKFITKYDWSLVTSIMEFGGYYLVSTKMSPNRLLFFPKNIEGAQEMSEFIKDKIK